MPRLPRLGLLIDGLRARPVGKQRVVHFLHVGKCAGTAIKDVAARVNALPDGPRIIGHGHSKKLGDIPPSEDYFFAVRDPLTRFISAFSMRKRKEQPRLYREWSDAERDAYARFPEANDLAESLFEASEAGLAAFSAMQSIGHLSFQHSWFRIRDLFATRPPLTILRQEKLAEDMATLLRLLGIDQDIALPADATRAHRNDYSGAPPLSEKARRNLSAWYAVDIEYYRLVTEWIESESGSGRSTVSPPPLHKKA